MTVRWTINTFTKGDETNAVSTSTSIANTGWTNTVLGSTGYRMRYDTRAVIGKLVVWGMSNTTNANETVYLQYKLKTIKRAQDSATTGKDISAHVTAQTKWSEKTTGNAQALS